MVEVLDPMILSSKVRESCECGQADGVNVSIPGGIRKLFDEELVMGGANRRLYVTLGQFSIVRLERDVQLIVPMVNYAIPEKECCADPGCSEDPCEMFSRIPFPTQQFTPQGCDRKDDCSCQ